MNHQNEQDSDSEICQNEQQVQKQQLPHAAGEKRRLISRISKPSTRMENERQSCDRVTNKSKQICREQKQKDLNQQVVSNKINLSKKKSKTLKERTCVICLEDMDAKDANETKLNCCQHTFCYDCIKMWLNTNCDHLCPHCRKIILNITHKDKHGKEKTEEFESFNSEMDEICERCFLPI